MLRLMGPDFVQTDCKGHPGLTSWFSKVPEASVSPGVVKDAMAQWRAATRKLGLPLHCHYSGVWDQAAARNTPSGPCKTQRASQSERRSDRTRARRPTRKCARAAPTSTSS